MIQNCMKLIVDCDFADHMKDTELNSLSKQLMYGHAENKKAPKPVNLILTGCVSSKLRGRLTSTGADNWGIDIYPKDDPAEQPAGKEGDTADNSTPKKACYTELFDKDKLVYLTADSENTIEKFEDDKIYIIGGIVDRNRHKNICLNKAKEQGIAHGKFPIKENVNIGDYSTVLTVNQVVSVILAVKKYDNDWERALKETLPHRKTNKVKGRKAKECRKEEEAKAEEEEEKQN